MIILSILKIIALIILALIGLLLLLLILPVSVKLEYIGEKKYYEVKYAFLSVFSSDSEKGISGKLKKQKTNKNKKSTVSSNTEKEAVTVSEPDEKIDDFSEIPNNSENISESEEKTEKTVKKSKPEKRSGKSSYLENLPELWDKIMQIWEIASSPARRLCKGIHLDKIFIDFKISDPDAYNCAIDYGKTCIVVYNTLGILNQMFSLSKKSINVQCVFNEKKSIYDISFSLRFHPITLLFCGISFLWTYYFKIYRKNSGGKNNNGKQRNKKSETDK